MVSCSTQEEDQVLTTVLSQASPTQCHEESLHLARFDSRCTVRGFVWRSMPMMVLEIVFTVARGAGPSAMGVLSAIFLASDS